MSIKEKFIQAIEDNVPPNNKIVYETDTIEIINKRCLPERFIKKQIILSWVEVKELNNE